MREPQRRYKTAVYRIDLVENLQNKSDTHHDENCRREHWQVLSVVFKPLLVALSRVLQDC